MMGKTAVAVLWAMPFVGMYVFADSVCVPSEHTPGFCPEWIAMGMLLPLFLCIGVTLAVLAIKSPDRK